SSVSPILALRRFAKIGLRSTSAGPAGARPAITVGGIASTPVEKAIGYASTPSNGNCGGKNVTNEAFATPGVVSSRVLASASIFGVGGRSESPPDKKAAMSQFQPTRDGVRSKWARLELNASAATRPTTPTNT